MNDKKKEEVEQFLNRTRGIYLSWGNLQNPGVVRDAMLHRLYKTDLSRPVLVPKWLIPATIAADFAFIGIGTITAAYVTAALTAIAFEIVLFGSGVSPLFWTLMGLL
jgi:hypothetical protein